MTYPVLESQIIFCPRFFKNKVHIDEYVEKHPNEDSTYLNKKFNGIYETVILHEWMHANVFGFSRGGSGTSEYYLTLQHFPSFILMLDI